MAMSVSSEMTFFSMKLQSAICAQLRTRELTDMPALLTRWMKSWAMARTICQECSVHCLRSTHIRQGWITCKKYCQELIPVSYHPELDITKELDADLMSYYIGPLNLGMWIHTAKLPFYPNISHLPMKDSLRPCTTYLHTSSHIRSLVLFSIQRTSALMGMEGFLWGRCRGIATRYTEPLGNAINLVCFVFKYTVKVCKNQIVTASRLVTVLDMRPQTRGTLTNNNDLKVCSVTYK